MLTNQNFLGRVSDSASSTPIVLAIAAIEQTLEQLPLLNIIFYFRPHSYSFKFTSQQSPLDYPIC